MRVATVLLWSLAFLFLAGVVLVELLALTTPAIPPPAWLHLRIPLRLATAGAAGLAAVGTIVRRAPSAVRRSPAPDQAVVEPTTLPVSAKQALLVLSIVTMAIGGPGLVAFLEAGPAVLRFNPGLGALAVAFGAGGAIGIRQIRNSLLGRPSQRFRLPPAWMLGLAFVLVVAVGTVTLRSDVGRGLGFALILLLGAALPPLAVLSFVAADLGAPPSARRVVMALVAGGTLSVVGAIVLEILLPGIVAILALPVGELVREIIAIIDEGRFSDLLSSPGALLLLGEVAIVAPLAEEAVKPLGAVILGRCIRTPRDAWFLGMAGGAGFALVENIAYEGGWIGMWTGDTLVRAIGAALHPFGAGLVALGWFGVLQRQPDAWRRLARYYGVAVGAHALWNGAVGIFAILEFAHRGVLGPVTLQGLIIDVGLVALFIAEGVGLIWAVHLVAQQLAETRPPLVAPARTHTLALWGLTCLGVLMPVALAAGGAVLQFLGALVR